VKAVKKQSQRIPRVVRRAPRLFGAECQAATTSCSAVSSAVSMPAPPPSFTDANGGYFDEVVRHPAVALGEDAHSLPRVELVWVFRYEWTLEVRREHCPGCAGASATIRGCG